MHLVVRICARSELCIRSESLLKPCPARGTKHSGWRAEPPVLGSRWELRSLRLQRRLRQAQRTTRKASFFCTGQLLSPLIPWVDEKT